MTRKRTNPQPEQLELFTEPTGMTPGQLEGLLSEGWQHPLSLKLTRNRVSMVSINFDPDGAATVRLHEAFLQAPTDVLAALRTYIRTRRRKAWNIVQEFVWGIKPEKHTTRRTPALRARGAVYDLREIQTEVNTHFFGGKVQCAIGWGQIRATRKARVRSSSVCFGTYHQSGNYIRINPKLDNNRVPREFVVYIVFHEMLHAAVPPVIRHGRLVHHTAQFRVLERKFPGRHEMERLAKRLADELHV